jgi:hypothetical protein
VLPWFVSSRKSGTVRKVYAGLSRSQCPGLDYRDILYPIINWRYLKRVLINTTYLSGMLDIDRHEEESEADEVSRAVPVPLSHPKGA